MAKTTETNKTKATESKALDKAKKENALIQFMPEDYEVVATGEITKWVDMSDDGMFTPDDEGAEAQPIIIEGVLLSRESIEDEDDDGNPIVRYFYNVRTMRPVPVKYKDEDKVEVTEIAQPGDIVAIGGRAKLEMLNKWATDGGIHQIFLRPTKKIKIGRGRQMWLFDIGHKLIRPGNSVYVAPMPQGNGPNF